MKTLFKLVTGLIISTRVLFNWLSWLNVCTDLSLEQTLHRERPALCCSMDLHRLNNAHSPCENNENNKVQRSCDTQMTEALRTMHLPQSIYSSVQFVWALQCISFSLDRPPSRPLSSSSGYTSNNQALMPWVKPGQCQPSSSWNADTVSKLSGLLLNYSTPEEKNHQV